MKALYILIFISLSVFATDISSLHVMYENQKYQEVIEEATQSYEHYNDATLHLLWAKSAQALGDDITAMSAYERVLLLEPSNRDAQIALVHLYKKLHRESLSDELRASLINQELSPAQRTALGVAYDDFVHKLNLSAKVSLGIDTNIGANSDLEMGTGELDEITQTLFTRASAQLNYVSYFDNAHWFWQVDAHLQAQNNFDADYYNLYDGLGSLGLGYKSDIFTLYIPALYGRMYYLERDFLEQYGTHPYLNFILSQDLILNFNFKYLQRRFIDPVDKLQNDDVLGSWATLFYYFNQGFIYAKGGYESYSAQEKIALSFTDKERMNFDIGISSRVNAYIFRADYHFASSNFDEEERSDTYNRIDLKAGFMFYKHWSLSLEYSYTNNDSNYKYASFDKNIMMSTLQYSY